MEPVQRITRRFPADIMAPATVRRFTRGVLADWQVVPDQALVIVSELATNAVVHAGTDFEVTLTLFDGSVRIEVADTDTRFPAPAVIPSGATGGRGLMLVEALATSWGVEPAMGSKVVWADVPLVLR